MTEAAAQMDVQTFLKLRDALAELRDRLAFHTQSLGDSPGSGSKAQQEISTFRRAQSVHTAQSQAWLLLEVSADQLTAFVKTVTEPIETIAPYTCVRSLLEASGLACWLLDPDIDAHLRIARSLALRYEGMVQQLRWARAAGEDASKAQRRLEDMVALADSLGYPAISDKRGRPTGAGQLMPSVTDIIAMTLEEEETYRLLSAIAHGHHWALQQLSFARAPEFDQISSLSGEKLSGLAKGANMTGLALMVFTAASTFARAVWYQGLYLGWDRIQFASLLDKEFDRLGATDRIRCWKPATT